MKRAHTYYENRRLWLGMDYVFAVDVDTRCVSYIGAEILGDTVGTLHADNAFYDGTEVSGMNLTSHGVDAGKATMWRQHLGEWGAQMGNASRGCWFPRQQSGLPFVFACLDLT